MRNTEEHPDAMLSKIIYAISFVFFCISGFVTYQAATLPDPVRGEATRSETTFYQSVLKQFYRPSGEDAGEGGSTIPKKIKDLWSQLGNSYGSTDDEETGPAEPGPIKPVKSARPEKPEETPSRGMKTAMLSPDMSQQGQTKGDDPPAIREADTVAGKNPSGDSSGVNPMEQSVQTTSTPNSTTAQNRVASHKRGKPRKQREPDTATFLEEKALMLITFGKGVFTYNQVQASQDIQQKINSALRIIKSYPDAIISIEGHADNIPLRASPNRPYNDNMGLSLWRATVVASKLTEAGIPASRIKVMGYGDARPVASNETAEGRAKNRRVEVRVLLQPSG